MKVVRHTSQGKSSLDNTSQNVDHLRENPEIILQLSILPWSSVVRMGGSLPGIHTEKLATSVLFPLSRSSGSRDLLLESLL